MKKHIICFTLYSALKIVFLKGLFSEKIYFCGHVKIKDKNSLCAFDWNVITWLFFTVFCSLLNISFVISSWLLSLTFLSFLYEQSSGLNCLELVSWRFNFLVVFLSYIENFPSLSFCCLCPCSISVCSSVYALCFFRGYSKISACSSVA